MSELALFGGQKAVTLPADDMFKWPIITKEDEEAALEVLRRGGMSGTDVTKAFEQDYCNWIGSKYALGHSSGTASLLAAMYGVGLGVGDEMITASVTYWATAIQCVDLGATPVFVDIDPKTMCIDPSKIEAAISPRTKAIMVVHAYSCVADMDPIMEIARKHNLKVIEDVSHAHGALYKGRKVGTIGDVGAMSLMSGKSLAIGEAGILVTDDLEIYERAVCLGHYERMGTLSWEGAPYFKPFSGLPLGGYKFRMHQLSSAVGRVQLAHYDERCEEIDKAMLYFWDCLKDVPCVAPQMSDRSVGSTNGGWYASLGVYKPEAVEGLSLTQFRKACNAEGVGLSAGANAPLHTHNLMQTCDIYGHGKPTRVANATRDVRELDKFLPVSEMIATVRFGAPWFKHFRPEVIEQYAEGIRKVYKNYKELLATDPGNPEVMGVFHHTRH